MQLVRRRLLALCTFAALAGLAPTPAAQAHPPRPSHWQPPVTQEVDVTVQDAFGRSLRTIRHQGKVFVAGEKGQRYAIRIDNPSSARIEVVVSVDGRDVVSGSPADFGRDRGYVVEPFGSVTVDGFRTSMRDVAAFRFSSVADSYSARRGTPANTGVIGVAVFHERTQPLARRSDPRDRAARGSAPPAPPAKPRSAAPGSGKAEQSKPAESRRGRSTDFAPAPTRELGTAFGEQMSSAVVQVAFVRRNASRPDVVTTVTYDTPRGLAARGVPIEPVLAAERAPDEPHAWPGAVRRFAPAPPR
jgi:hypothetical protein